jgi:hypothetical protein
MRQRSSFRQLGCFGALGLMVIGSSNALAGSLESNASRSLGSQLRSQPGEQEPAWYVERADNSTLGISVLTQTRFSFSDRETGFIAPNDDVTLGFSMPRTRVALEGTIVSSQFNYRISMDFGDAELSRGRGSGSFLAGDTGTARLLDAYGQYNFSGKRDGYYLKFGQFQNVLMTEESVASEYQQAIDRSLSTELFGPGYTQGVALGNIGSNFAWELSLTDGGRYVGSRETDNTSFDSLDEADLGVGFRADWKLSGSWDQFADFASFRGSNSGTKIGAGFLYQFQGQTNPGDFTPPFVGSPAESSQIVTWTLDYQHEGDGWNFFAAYTGQWVDWEFAAATLGTLHNSVVVQGGLFVTDSTELFARLDTFWLDKAYRNGFGTPNGYIHRIATAGINYYLIPESHAAKLSADVSYAFDSLFAVAVGAGDTIGLPDPSTTGFIGLSAHEYVIRFQLQLLF